MRSTVTPPWGDPPAQKRHDFHFEGVKPASPGDGLRRDLTARVPAANASNSLVCPPASKRERQDEAPAPRRDMTRRHAGRAGGHIRHATATRKAGGCFVGI